jgi:hypothetical protein
MSSNHLSCPKCAGSMEAGFILDRAHMNVLTVSQWLEGEPETSFWTGLKTKNRERYAVATYRCQRCGFLESYAKQP